MAPCEIEIRPVQSPAEEGRLDELLWQVLWRPIGLPRDVRASFVMDGEKIELVAIKGSAVIGCLVAYRLSGAGIELRHIAVRPGYQTRSIGSQLVRELIAMAAATHAVTIRTFARNTSVGFFGKLGFRPVNDEWIEHPPFAAHGIKIRQMEYKV